MIGHEGRGRVDCVDDSLLAPKVPVSNQSLAIFSEHEQLAACTKWLFI